MDTIEKRWARLAPHVHVYGPADETPRPAVLLFHGCGGLREHIDAYAAAAARAGWRAFCVDSYAARGWTHSFGLTFVCTGLTFWGSERAGDVMAAAWGVARRPDVLADRLVLAGWSHGGWAVMDLMTMPLARRGEAGLADPSEAPLAGVKGLFLVYPYVRPPALTRTRPWRRRLPVSAVVARTDHLTSVDNAERVLGRTARIGCDLDLWVAEGSHAFDEPACTGPMRYDAALAAECEGRFTAFLERMAAEP